MNHRIRYQRYQKLLVLGIDPSNSIRILDILGWEKQHTRPHATGREVNFKTLYSHNDTGLHEEDGSNVLKLFREAVPRRPVGTSERLLGGPPPKVNEQVRRPNTLGYPG